MSVCSNYEPLHHLVCSALSRAARDGSAAKGPVGRGARLRQHRNGDELELTGFLRCLCLARLQRLPPLFLATSTIPSSVPPSSATQLRLPSTGPRQSSPAPSLAACPCLQTDWIPFPTANALLQDRPLWLQEGRPRDVHRPSGPRRAALCDWQGDGRGRASRAVPKDKPRPDKDTSSRTYKHSGWLLARSRLPRLRDRRRRKRVSR